MMAVPAVLTGQASQLLMAAVALAACGGYVAVAVRAWRDAALLDREGKTMAERLLAPLARRMAPRTDIQVREIRQQLVRAGLRDDNAVRRFTMLRTAVVVAAGALVLLLRLTTLSMLPFLLLSASIFYASLRLPDRWIAARIAKRQASIARALPTVVDLMVLCLEVGLSIEAAFARVTTEIRSMEPLMAEEASITGNEMSAGLTFAQAFSRLAERVDLAELTTMARLVAQAASLGASITQSLREYSETSFAKRVLDLEEQAGKISAKLVLPLTLCMLPSCLLALGGPAALMVIRALGS